MSEVDTTALRYCEVPTSCSGPGYVSHAPYILQCFSTSPPVLFIGRVPKQHICIAVPNPRRSSLAHERTFPVLKEGSRQQRLRHDLVDLLTKEATKYTGRNLEILRQSTEAQPINPQSVIGGINGLG